MLSYKITSLFCALCVMTFGSLTVLAVDDVLEKYGLASAESDLTITADTMEYSQDSKVATAVGDVVAEYGNLRLTAGKVQINQETLDFVANDNVSLEVEALGSWKCPAVKGNIRSRSFDFGPFRIDGEIWHAGGEGAIGQADGTKELKNAWLTTCDCEKPHYCLRAKKIIHHADQTFAAKHVFLEFGGIPVFYLPYLWGSTNTNQAGWIFQPGYSGKKGANIRIGRIWRESQGDGELMAYGDAMWKRGIGLGLEGDRSWKNGGGVSFLAYGLHDLKAPGEDDGYDRRFKSKDDRFRLHLYDHSKLADKLSLRMNLDVLSDISMLEDWFRHDYRDEYQPKSFANLSYDSKRWSLGLNVRPRVNSFYTVVETLPELTLEIPTQHVLDLPFTYSSSNSMGYYRMRWREFSKDRWYFYSQRIRNGLELLDDRTRQGYLSDNADYSSFRADTLHTLALPIELGDAMTFTPRASFRATSYSRSSRLRLTQKDLAEKFNADNPDATRSLAHVRNYDNGGGSFVRVASEYGAELKTRLYSDWTSWRPWHLLEIDGVRHVIEPYANYTFAPSPSKDRDYIYFFDEIDRLERQNFIRLGVNQAWQTKTDGKIRQLALWQSYFDMHLIRGKESDRYPGDLGNRLELMPHRFLGIDLAMLHDVGEGHIQRGEAGFRIGEKEKLNMKFAYIYRNDHLSRSVYSMGSELVDITGESSYVKKYFETADTATVYLHVPINALTWLDCKWEYDFDKSRLAEHTYALTRVMHCWTMETGIGWEDGDFEAFLLFRLTAFPKVKVNMGF